MLPKARKIKPIRYLLSNFHKKNKPPFHRFSRTSSISHDFIHQLPNPKVFSSYPSIRNSRIISDNFFFRIHSSWFFKVISIHENRLLKSILQIFQSRTIFFIYFTRIFVVFFISMAMRIIGKPFRSFPNGFFRLQDAEHVLKYFSR